MTRLSRTHATHLFVAQSARKEARHAEEVYAMGQPLSAAAAALIAPRPLSERAAVAAPFIAWRAAGLPTPTPEFRFHPIRKWRFDFAWPEKKLALEIEGGVWTGGRHSGGAGAVADLEKYSEAAILGWKIIYCQPKELQTIGMDRVRRALG